MQARPGSLDTRTRVQRGLKRENQIAEALRDQAGLQIVDATPDEDKERKVDRWIESPEGRIAVQIKYREVGTDLLFEVYDKFNGWDDPNNKLGRDMFGDAEQYAVLLSDRKTVIMVPTATAKALIEKMIAEAKKGWTEISHTKTLNYRHNGILCQLKAQSDPADGRSKMVAYIPPVYFWAESQAKVYSVNMPTE